MCELYGRITLGWDSEATTLILCELKTTTGLKLGQVSSWSLLPAREASFLLQRWEYQSPSAPRQWGWQRWAGRFRDARICPHTCVHRVKSMLTKFNWIWGLLKAWSNSGQGNGLNIRINDSLGESLVGEKNWQTISNILLTIVLSPIPGEVQVKK